MGLSSLAWHLFSQEPIFWATMGETRTERTADGRQASSSPRLRIKFMAEYRKAVAERAAERPNKVRCCAVLVYAIVVDRGEEFTVCKLLVPGRLAIHADPPAGICSQLSSNLNKSRCVCYARHTLKSSIPTQTTAAWRAYCLLTGILTR